MLKKNHSQIKLLEASFEKIKSQAKDFVNSFYNYLFIVEPEIQEIFTHVDIEQQQRMLISSLSFIIENLSRPDILSAVLKGLGARHIKYGVLPEYYPLFGETLLVTLETYLGSSWTEELRQAWLDTYTLIAKLMLEGTNYNPQVLNLNTTPIFPSQQPVDMQQLIYRSIELVKPQKEEFMTSFYQNLFLFAPQLEPIFAHLHMVKQRSSVFNFLYFVAENLSKPEVLSATLKGLGARHIKYGARPEYYPLFGQALLVTLEQYLEQEWTMEIKRAWLDTYNVITSLMLKGADYEEEKVKLMPKIRIVSPKSPPPPPPKPVTRSRPAETPVAVATKTTPLPFPGRNLARELTSTSLGKSHSATASMGEIDTGVKLSLAGGLFGSIGVLASLLLLL